MDFYRRMEIVCGIIPAGRAATYGQIAALCGAPKNARQVGYALRSGRVSGVPAWRIVSGSGFLSGAVYFPGYRQQALMLEEEGVPVISTPSGDRVDLGKFGWHHTEQEAEMLRRLFRDKGI